MEKRDEGEEEGSSEVARSINTFRLWLFPSAGGRFQQNVAIPKIELSHINIQKIVFFLKKKKKKKEKLPNNVEHYDGNLRKDSQCEKKIN